MTDTTIAAGEIREYEAYGERYVLIYPFDCEWKGTWVRAYNTPHGGLRITSSALETSFRPAEARDFARAILAAADWAERQGRW